MTCTLNCKRFALSTICGFIFTFIYDFIVHGILVKPMYDETAQLWRPESTMVDYMPIAMVVSLLTIITSLYIFTRNFEGKGISEGIRFGAMMGTLIGIIMFGMYVYLPIPMTLAITWFIASFAWMLGLGIIFSITYKK